MNKKAIYASYGIEYLNGKINAPMFGFINPLLINGNAKLGKSVWTFSTLAGTGFYKVDMGNNDIMECKGTCVCDCHGCYAKTGFYRFANTEKALAIRTALARLYPNFAKNAIIAQIHADNIKLCRIHASGDFFSMEYVGIWQDIANACKACKFWSYTKNPQAESAFDSIPNVNIVKSLIPNCGINFGHCDYILDTYNKLAEQGKKVHLCKCGFDKNQHCNTCKGCSENEYVLFVEHSTSYKAEKDINYPKLAEIALAKA